MKLALIGRMRSGKDTVAVHLKDNHRFISFAFADAIKEICEMLFPEAVAAGKPRKLYQDVGELMKEIDPHVWIKHLNRRMKNTVQCDSNIVVTDVRHENEVKFLQDQGFVFIHIFADLETRLIRMLYENDQVTMADINNESEEIDILPVDYQIQNIASIETLHHQVDQIVERIRSNDYF